MQQEGVQLSFVIFVRVLNACASVITLEEGRCVHQQIAQSGMWAIAWWTCMQNVGVLRMLGECLTRCHLKMWSLGLPYLEDVPCMGMVGKDLNILNRCVKKVHNQMISILFVFCQLVAMQVWWTKEGVCMLQ